MKPLTNNSPKRVLMIAAAFPPVGGSGVQRTVKFCKYLPTFGWQPTVWAVDEYDGLPTDSTLLDDLPKSVEVFRYSNTNFVKEAKKSLQRIGSIGSVLSMVTAAMDWRLTRWHERLSWPDQLIPWAKNSVKPLLDLIEEQPFDVVYSTYSPVSNHWLAMEIKQRTGLPWIADFRDLWTDDCSYTQISPSHHRADKRLQRTFLEQADAVVAVSPGQTDILADHISTNNRKFSTITNGFDPDDFRNSMENVDLESHCNDKFVFAHVGTLAGWRTMDALLNGMAAFVDSIGDRKHKFEFRSAGILGHGIENRIVSRGIPLTTKGYVPHLEAVAQMQSADALLLYCGPGQNASTVINGKLFEYLASRTPILCIGDQNAEISKIVRGTQSGLVVPCDPASICQGLRKLFDAWEAKRPILGCAAELLDPYSRVTTTAQLALILDKLATPQHDDCKMVECCDSKPVVMPRQPDEVHQTVLAGASKHYGVDQGGLES